MKAALLAVGILLSAPYQCATEPNERPTEDSAPKALWMLSERFEKDGQADARKTTLQQLVEQYPSSRYAERARQALGKAGDEPEKPTEDSPESGDR
jgi:TolA-binding protein